MKPKLKDLQEFTKQYFKKKCPVVRWKQLKDCIGQAELKKRIIYLDPIQQYKKSEYGFGCGAGEGFYKANTKIKLSEWEAYFATLLHEIGHFKISVSKPHKRFEKLKRKITKELRNGKFKIDDDNIVYWAEDYLNDWDILEFRSWLGNYSMENHIKVENWAIKEFKKQRRKINKILIN